jgi:phosphate transport system permease protein
MSTPPPLDVPARARFATNAARAATESLYRDDPTGDRVSGILFRAIMMLSVAFAMLAMSSILIWAMVEGAPRFNTNLFVNPPSVINLDTAGFRTALLGTVYVISGVVLIIVPVGVGTAIYLERYARRDNLFTRIIDLNIQNLAGVPSIVFGILALAFIARGPLQLGFTVLTGQITLSALVLPTIILASREAIRAVPSSIPDGSMALGATRWQTIRYQILPFAAPGIMTGAILSIARAIGEAAPLLLIGAVTFITRDPQLTTGSFTTLPVQIFSYAARPQAEFREIAAAGVVVMLIVVFVMNGFAVWLRNRYENKLL